ncbi:hypothetical protein PhCBS80983_g01817 [Powellomyces hirtus]|uniref:AB hydrolase-1 domain-containing protein n=1 Tax=Powellomyces hirtus TaxID=109895 RepID=A0A507EBH6_9FUNG|nr:hypothetical protein PhCBS80983_g01817 [Powellomyces hirtus]
MPKTDILELPDGGKLAYKVLGTKGMRDDVVPLILLMGLSGVKEDWSSFAQGLAQHRPVCIVDNRGIGESSQAKPKPPFREAPQLTIMQMATDAFSLIEHLDWRRFHLLGFSMGGMMAQQLVCLLRGRDDYECVSLNLLGTTPKGQLRGFLAEYSGLLGAQMEARETGQQGKFTMEEKLELYRTMLERNFTTQWCLNNPTAIDFMIAESPKYKKPMRIIAQQMEAIAEFDVVQQLQFINIPTLVVHGTADQVVPVQAGQAVAGALPKAEFVPLPDIGHMTYLMDGGESLRLFNKFLHHMDEVSRTKSLQVKL